MVVRSGVSKDDSGTLAPDKPDFFIKIVRHGHAIHEQVVQDAHIEKTGVGKTNGIPGDVT